MIVCKVSGFTGFTLKGTFQSGQLYHTSYEKVPLHIWGKHNICATTKQPCLSWLHVYCTHVMFTATTKGKFFSVGPDTVVLSIRFLCLYFEWVWNIAWGNFVGNITQTIFRDSFECLLPQRVCKCKMLFMLAKRVESTFSPLTRTSNYFRPS